MKQTAMDIFKLVYNSNIKLTEIWSSKIAATICSKWKIDIDHLILGRKQKCNFSISLDFMNNQWMIKFE